MNALRGIHKLVDLCITISKLLKNMPLRTLYLFDTIKTTSALHRAQVLNANKYKLIDKLLKHNNLYIQINISTT
jgi:hypothetical protein